MTLSSLKVQNSIGFVGLVILIMIALLAASWGITCLFVYWISLLWAGTAFAFTWSWEFATGVWLALALLGGFTSARVNVNDR
jgi:hypothetical protein